MSGSAWKQKAKKKPSGTIADWCDANLPSSVGAKVAGLVAKSEATFHVVGILKVYRTRSAVLSGAQRLSLEAELKGAGQWSQGEAAARAPAPPR